VAELVRWCWFGFWSLMACWIHLTLLLPVSQFRTNPAPYRAILRFAADGRYLAAGHGTSAHIYDTATGERTW
jgi:hypothetical protein